MSKITIPDDSPLAYRSGETQGSYWDRIGGHAKTLIENDTKNEQTLRTLGFIAQALPSDFDWGSKENLFKELKQFLSKLEDFEKNFFKETFLAHGGHRQTLGFFLPKNEQLSLFGKLDPTIPVQLFKS